MSFRQTLTFKDAFNGKTTRTFYLSAADYTTARADADSNLTAIQAISLGGVIKDELTERTDVAGVPGAEANIDVDATFNWDLGAGKTSSTQLPMPVYSIINSDRTVDVTNVNVVAWTDGYTSGNILVSDGEVVQSVIGGTLDK